MHADFYTKPLQGNLFRKFRDVIMVLQHISTLKRKFTLTDQEHVRNNGIAVIHNTGTMDVRGSENMILNNNDVSTSEASHTFKKEIFVMHEIHDVTKIRMYNRNESYDNIVKGVQ